MKTTCALKYTILRITLFSLLSITLSHAMEEKNITSGKKNNHQRQGSGDYSSFSKKRSTEKSDLKGSGDHIHMKSKKELADEMTDIYTKGTKLLLRQSIHTLKEGKIPGKKTKLSVVNESRGPLKPLTTVRKAEEFFSDQMYAYLMRKKKSKERYNTIMHNAKKLWEKNNLHDQSRPTETKFSIIVNHVNPLLLPQLNTEQLKTFNNHMVNFIQKETIRHTNDIFHGKVEVMDKEFINFRNNLAAANRRGNRWKNTTVYGGSALLVTGIVAHQAGYITINTDRMATHAGMVATKTAAIAATLAFWRK